MVPIPANIVLNLSVHIGSRFVASLAGNGAANSLGLASTYHGTNPFSWLSIHLMGADPSWGASDIGGDYGMGYDYQNVNRFYMARDNHRSSPFEAIYVRFLSKMYASMSTINLLARHKLLLPVVFVPGMYLGMLVPSIKFRFDQTEADQFLTDRTLACACSTDNSISPLRIGLVGTLTQGLNSNLLTRMSENRLRVLTGVAQIAIAAVAIHFFVLYYPAIFATYKVNIIASAALSLV